MRHIVISFLLTTNFALAQEILWVRNGENSESHFGAGLYPLGDQNDDGFDDWAVWSNGEQVSDDRFDFFYGGNPPSQTPYMSYAPQQNPVSYLNTHDVIGDFNGDGFVDWWLWYWTPGLDCVRIEMYAGGVTADTLPEQVFFYIPYEATRMWGGAIGDHNGDGYDDVYLYDNVPSPMRDRTLLIWGNADWEAVPDLRNSAEPQLSQNTLPKAVGDFNGDGFLDIVTSSNPPGTQTFFFWGAESPDTVADIQWDGEFALHSTLSADLNSDGAADLAICRTPGRVDVHLGGIAPLSTPTFILEDNGCPSGALWVWSAGDFNRDGYEDLVVVDSYCDFGSLSLYLGGPWLNSAPVLEFEGLFEPPFEDVEIWRAIGLGDVNGDGIDDLAIGCQGDVWESPRGRVVILSGDTTLDVPVGGFPPLAEEYSMSIYPNPFNSTLSISLDVPLHLDVTLSLYDLLGREVDVVYRGRLSSNTISYVAPAALASGVYFLRASTNSQSVLGKVVLLK